MDSKEKNFSNNYQRVICTLQNPPANKREICLKKEKELFIQFYFQFIEQYSQQTKDNYCGIVEATENDIKESAGKEFFKMMVKFRSNQLCFCSANNEQGALLGGCFFYAYNTHVIITSLFTQDICDLVLFERIYYGMMAVIQKIYPNTTSIVIFKRTLPEVCISKLQNYGFAKTTLQFYESDIMAVRRTWYVDAYEHHLSTYERWCTIS